MVEVPPARASGAARELLRGGRFQDGQAPLDVNQRHPHVLSSPFRASVKCLDEIPLRLLRHGESVTLWINDFRANGERRVRLR